MSEARIRLYRVVDKDGWPEMPLSVRTELYVDKEIADGRAAEMNDLDELNSPYRVECFIEVRGGDTVIDLFAGSED